MKITQVTYTRGATINRGNFNSERIDFSATAQVDGETEDEAYSRLREWVNKKVVAEVKEIVAS